MGQCDDGPVVTKIDTDVRRDVCRMWVNILSLIDLERQKTTEERIGLSIKTQMT